MDKLLKELIDLSKPRYTHNPSGAPLTAQDIVQEMNNHRSPLYQQFFSQLTLEHNIEEFIKQVLWEKRLADQYEKEILREYELHRLIAKSKLPIYNDELDEEYDRQVLEIIINKLLEQAKNSLTNMLEAISKMQTIQTRMYALLEPYNKAKYEHLSQCYSKIMNAIDAQIENSSSEEEKEKLLQIKEQLKYIFENQEAIKEDIRNRRLNGQNDLLTNKLIGKEYNDIFQDILSSSCSYLSNGQEYAAMLSSDLDDTFNASFNELKQEFKSTMSDYLKATAKLDYAYEAAEKLGKAKDFGKALHDHGTEKLVDKIKEMPFAINAHLDNDNKYEFKHH